MRREALEDGERILGRGEIVVDLEAGHLGLHGDRRGEGVDGELVFYGGRYVGGALGWRNRYPGHPSRRIT